MSWLPVAMKEIDELFALGSRTVLHPWRAESILWGALGYNHGHIDGHSNQNMLHTPILPPHGVYRHRDWRWASGLQDILR